MSKSLLVMGLLVMSSAFASAKADLSKSQVKWEGKKVVGDAHWGYLSLKKSELQLTKEGVPSAGQVVVDLNSITVKDLEGEKANDLKGHLLSDDFFAASKYPEATFVIKKVSPVTSATKPIGIAQYKVEGDLTIKDKTNEEAFVVSIDNTSSKVAKVTGDLVFDRTKYGVMFNSNKLSGVVKNKVIKDEVKLNLDLIYNK